MLSSLPHSNKDSQPQFEFGSQQVADSGQTHSPKVGNGIVVDQRERPIDVQQMLIS